MVALLPSTFRRIDQLQTPVDKRREPWKVQPGSSLYLDDEASSPVQVSHTAQRLFLVAIDHLTAVRILLAPNQEAPEQITGHLHIYADYTLLRGALEASLTALWLLRPADRMTRVARSVVLAQQDAFDAAVAVPSDEDRELMRAQGRSRVQPVLDRNPGMSKPARVPMTTMLTEAVAGTRREGVVTMWRLCSGMAHARFWATQVLSSNIRLKVGPDTYHFRSEGDLSNVAMMLHEAVAILDSAIGIYEGRALPSH
ncbi:hypothetical protein GCM10023153_15260 [Ornithinibacter aureus]|uniref:Uncharacterized protein n=2 Tax=Ornithinibacter aureus TaxID=622664 RepID=A0ABP8JQ77_9MICO